MVSVVLFSTRTSLRWHFFSCIHCMFFGTPPNTNWTGSSSLPLAWFFSCFGGVLFCSPSFPFSLFLFFGLEEWVAFFVGVWFVVGLFCVWGLGWGGLCFVFCLFFFSFFWFSGFFLVVGFCSSFWLVVLGSCGGGGLSLCFFWFFCVVRCRGFVFCGAVGSCFFCWGVGWGGFFGCVFFLTCGGVSVSLRRRPYGPFHDVFPLQQEGFARVHLLKCASLFHVDLSRLPKVRRALIVGHNISVAAALALFLLKFRPCLVLILRLTRLLFARGRIAPGPHLSSVRVGCFLHRHRVLPLYLPRVFQWIQRPLRSAKSVRRSGVSFSMAPILVFPLRRGSVS